MYGRRCVIALLALMLVAPGPEAAFAARKKVSKKAKPPQVIQPDNDGYYTQVGKRSIYCLNQTVPGTTKTAKNGQVQFTSLADAMKAAKKKKNNSLYLKLRDLSKKAKRSCNVLETSDLAKYNGPFTLKHAQRLVEVFALGGRPGLADQYVAMGMEAAIQDLTTWKDDSAVDAFVTKLRCGPNPRNTTTPDVCFENGNINDFYLDGTVAGINYRMIRSNNPAFMKLAQFVLDERSPGNPRVLDGESQWNFPPYLDLVERFMRSGNYKQYVMDVVNDPFSHGYWLSGKANHQGLLKTGNEDFAREAMELLTTGLYYPDGNPVYNDLDVFRNSQCMSGLAETRVRNADNSFTKAIGYVPAFHTPGPKVLFAGTPHELVCDTASDFAREIFIAQKNQVAYELAWRLWRRYINDKGTTTDHLKLAKLIIDNDFNLWPVLKKMMASEAFYADGSRKTILKDPHTFFVTFARMTGIPPVNYQLMSGLLDDIGGQIGKPPSVFGFNYQNRLLASDVYQLERYNSLMYYSFWQDGDDLQEYYGWTPHSGLVAGIPLTGDPGRDLVNETLKRLNLTDSWSVDQKAALQQFLDYYLGDCYSNTDPACFMLNNVRKKWYRDVADLGDTEDNFHRLRLGYVMAAFSPAFSTM